jgi:glycerophosphoryl diester phosphodiesterase
MPHPFFELAGPLVIGHRGAAGEAPENTLLAFGRGLELGAQILESDVHATRDGVPVLAHDADLTRMTGAANSIGDHDLASLQRLDAAFGFAGPNDDFPLRGEGHHVPSLAEAFERFPGVRFNLEIKDAAPGLVERVFETIAEHERGELTLLTAEKDDVMARIRAERRNRESPVAIGASVADVLAYVRSAVAHEAPETDSMALQIPTEFGGQPLITEQLVRHAHDYGTQIHAWTINDEQEMERLLALGVDGLVTDHPGRMVSLLERRAAG